MKALALLTAVTVTLFSVAASAQTYGAPYGKGKAANGGSRTLDLAGAFDALAVRCRSNDRPTTTAAVEPGRPN